MTEAGWTREKPTVAGWYWWRRDQHALPGVAIVCSDLSGYYMNRTGHNSTFDHVDDVIGEWLGPITPDSYQQGMAAAFKQGIEKLREREKFYTEQEAISEGQMRLTRGLQRNESSCCIHELEKLAQAAQDEKGVGDAEN